MMQSLDLLMHLGYPLETQAGNSKHPTQMQMSFMPLKDGTTICHHHVDLRVL